MKINTSFSLDIDVATWLEQARGREARSMFVNNILKERMNNETKSN